MTSRAVVQSACGMRTGRGFTLLEMLLVIGIMALIGAVVIVRLPSFSQSDARLAAQIQQQFERVAQHGVLSARPVEAFTRPNGLGFREYRAGKWQPLPENSVTLGATQRLVMVKISDGKVVSASGRLRADTLGRWPLLKLEIYKGSTSIRTFGGGG